MNTPQKKRKKNSALIPRKCWKAGMRTTNLYWKGSSDQAKAATREWFKKMKKLWEVSDATRRLS